MSYQVINPFIQFVDPINGKPLSGGYVYFGRQDSDPKNQPANRLNVYAVQDNGTEVLLAQPITLNGAGQPQYSGSVKQLKVDTHTGESAYSVQVFNSGGAQKGYTSRAYSLIDSGSLADVNSSVIIAGVPASQIGNIRGNDLKKHFSIGAIPRCNSSGVFELINDAVHNPMNVTSVTQPDQYTIRINYAKTATKINTFIAAPDAELAPFGVVCGGDVGTSFANIQAYAPLNFIADNNSPNPSIVLNNLWQPSIGVASMVVTRVNSATLRVTHPPTFNNEAPAVTTINANNLFDFVASYGPTQIDVTCVGDAAGFLSYNGSAWVQSNSPNASAPTLTWTASSTLRVDHNQSYNSIVVPQVTGQGGALIPQVTNIGATFFEVSFYDYAGVKVTTQATTMQLWYRLNLKVPCAWPAGNIVSVQRGMVHVPSYNFKGVTGNNLWVYGDFEYA